MVLYEKTVPIMSTLSIPTKHTRLKAEAGSLRALKLPSALSQVVWRGDEIGSPIVSTLSSGWAELDKVLPGGGWPGHAVTEVLTAQPSVLEWRMLSPGLRLVVDAGSQVVVIGPPREPHIPGLLHMGLSEGQFIWIQAQSPAERLWATEQLIKSNSAGAIVSWLPKVRPEQVRRLQVCAQACEAPVFLCRPEAVQYESSAAPLRVHASASPDWELNVRILKRKGPPHEHTLVLPSVPGGLASILTPRLRRPSALTASEVPHVVGRPFVASRSERAAA